MCGCRDDGSLPHVYLSPLLMCVYARMCVLAHVSARPLTRLWRTVTFVTTQETATACAKIEIFRTNRCPELQTHSNETGPTRHALQSPSQHRRSSFWTLTQPIRPSTSLKLAQTDPKWPPRDRAIWRANGCARPKPRAGWHAKRRQSAHHVCACVRRHQLPPDHDP